MSALAQTFAATSASALASRKSSSFNARSSLMTSSTTTSSSSSSRGARLQTFARVDGGVGVFGNKAGMTQIFTDDGLCVPVTVIAVKDGNYVSAVSLFVAFKNFISTGNPGCFWSKKWWRSTNRRRSQRVRVARRRLKTIDERIKSFETNTSLRESVFLSSSVRSRDGFQPIVPRERGDFSFRRGGPLS